MIRLYRDHRGGRWEVVLGRESWGVLVALFVSRDEDDVRRVVLDQKSREDAHEYLSGVDAEALDGLFQRSEPRGE